MLNKNDKPLPRLLEKALKSRPGFDARRIATTIDDALDKAGLRSGTGAVAQVRATIDRALASAGLSAGAVSPQTATAAPRAHPVADVVPGAVPRAAGRDVRAPEAFTTRTFTHHAGTRAYKLFVPPSAREAPAGTVPLVLMLHGCTQSAEDFAAGTGMNALAERHGFVVAYPEQTANANGSKCWNWFRADDQHGDRGEASLLAGLAERIVADHALDGGRVFVAGLSAGAAMAVILGQVRPDLFAAVGVHSGLPYRSAHDVSSAFAAMGGRAAANDAPAAALVPSIVFHGDADGTVAPGNGAAVVRSTVAAAGDRVEREAQAGIAAGGRAYERIVYRDPAGAAIAEHWVVKGAGHAWSGGSAAGTYTDPAGPSASAEMVRFFLAQPRRARRNAE